MTTLTEQQQDIIDATVAFVKETLQHAEGGHDWWHIWRVWNTTKKIARTESCNGFVAELGALLHEIADSKFHGGDETIGPVTARRFLEHQAVDGAVIADVENIIRHISFKGGTEKVTFRSAELDVVQDADRLDALGAIGIARAFNYGGFKNRKLYDPTIPVNLNKTKEQYKHNEDPTINHFYEKLLLLQDRMNTATGKQLAQDRHHFMESFLSQFYREWNAEA